MIERRPNGVSAFLRGNEEAEEGEKCEHTSGLLFDHFGTSEPLPPPPHRNKQRSSTRENRVEESRREVQDRRKVSSGSER